MEYTGKYWTIIAPFIKKCLRHHYGREFARSTMKKAKQVYMDMLNKVDDVGKDNPMASNIYEAFVFLAVWKAADGRITEKALRMITREVLGIRALRAMGFVINLNTEKGVRRLGEMMHRDAEWLTEHPEYKDVSWDFNFDETKHRDGFYYHFTRCPLEAYARREGMLDILPVMCDIDHLTAGLMHAKLHRENTLARGGALCDYWYYGDELENPM